MTNMREPLGAVEENDRATGTAVDGELTSLVRRWMAVGTTVQDRVRRESILRVAPEPERAQPDRMGGTHVAPVVVDRVLASAPLPPLPRRTTDTDTSQGNRIALLIDARRMSADVATGLLARVGERGSVYVCRAYADWGSADLGDWVRRLRQEGLHSFHQFSDDGEQALVAMTIDAMDIARDAAVDEVVIAGDLTSALPLVHRLHGAGVRVVAVGAGHTPDDVRAACDEFIDTAFIDGVVEGRHRA